MKPSNYSDSPRPLAVCLPSGLTEMLRGVLLKLGHPLCVMDSRVTAVPGGLPVELRADWLGYQALEQASIAFQIESQHAPEPQGISIAGEEFEDAYLFAVAVQTREQTTLDLLSVPLDRLLPTMRQLVDALPQIALPVDAHLTETFPKDISADGLWSLEKTGWHASDHLPIGGLLSGSFFPLHAGHRALREVASELIAQPVRFELTAWNADKPPLDPISLSRRLAQFSPGEVCVSSLPTFVQKSQACPGTTFVIGWDTALRVLDDRFYTSEGLTLALDAIAERQCRFLVAARRSRDKVRTLADLKIPSRYTNLFAAIPTELFLEEVSSTELREAWWRGESQTPLPQLFPK